MQCVILAAGKGSRMMPLTEQTPKPLITVCGKPILDHILEALPAEITEVILVTNYLEDQIKARYGAKWGDLAFTYVTQENPAGGTGAALLCAKNLVTDKFLFMYADDVHGKEALAAVVKEEHAMLAIQTDAPEQFGILVLHENGTLKQIIEKPALPPSNLANIGGWVLHPDIFDFVSTSSATHGEVLATDMITAYAAEHPVNIVEQSVWIPIGSSEQLAKAKELLCGVDVDSADEI
jgi:bifunctional UDP-N-acetylglucosamine pyrophosphorylase/glucosamine-1-phosphate N-acetyltransferase